MSFGFGFGFTKITAAIRAAFSPSSLFAANEPGVWYDPSDFSTMFQDAAGTIPVTAVEQPVGLMLDKSKGLVLGPELVTNGDFSNGTTGWTTSNATISAQDGKLLVNATSQYGQARQNFNTVVGKWYLVTGDITPVTGSWALQVSDGTVTGTNRLVFLASTTVVTLRLLMSSTGSGSALFDNISVRELPGNHAFQSVATTSRPVLSARYNLLTKTEQFNDAVWFKASSGSGVLPTVSADAGLSPVGAQTADLITINRSTTTGLSFLTQRLSDDGTQKSRILHVKAFSASDVGKVLDTWTFDTAVANRFAITLTAEWQKVTLPNVTLSAGASRETVAFGYLDNGSLSPNTGQIKFYIWGASLVPANQAHLPYQRVNTATDYDADPAKFPHYLRFDGVDDWLVTNTITPGTDKVQVFAGVRRIANGGVALELSVGSYANDGSFFIYAGDRGSAAGPYWTVGSRGSVAANVTQDVQSPGSYNAPLTNVITSNHDIIDDRTFLRINGSQIGAATGDKGTGNFLAYPLYIGRRGGTTLPFNGYLYSLIVRFGNNLPIETIEKTEEYINTKTRAF